MRQLTGEDIDVLRLMLDGEAVTLEVCDIWNKWTTERWELIENPKTGKVRKRVVKERHEELIGYELAYIQRGEKLRDGLFAGFIKRHLVVPVTVEDKQTFVLTPTGEQLAMYEQSAFEKEIGYDAEQDRIQERCRLHQQSESRESTTAS